MSTLDQYPDCALDQEDWLVTPEQTRKLIGMMREATEQVPSHVSRYKDNPGLLDREMREEDERRIALERTIDPDIDAHVADEWASAIRDNQIAQVPESELLPHEVRAAFVVTFQPNY